VWRDWIFGVASKLVTDWQSRTSEGREFQMNGTKSENACRAMSLTGRHGLTCLRVVVPTCPMADPKILKGAEDNLSAPSSFIANAHNEIYALYTEKSGFIEKNMSQ